MDTVRKLKIDFNDSSDLIVKKIDDIVVVYLESLSSSDKVNEYVLKVLALDNPKKLERRKIAGPNTKEVTSYKEIIDYLNNGFTIIIGEKIYAVETKGELNRSIDTPTTEPSIYGPKDSFNESIQTNLGLVKRRIKSNNLINDDMIIGKYTKTKISVLYVEDIANKDLVLRVKDKLKNVNIDGIIDAGNIKQLITEENKSPFPTIELTERPDKVAIDLLEGKIALLIDTSPYALIMPTFFGDFINPIVDTYSKNININFLKFIRFFCLILTIFLPAFYLALINYNQGSIPLELLVKFAVQRDNVPFPAFVEGIFMLILCAILRESDIRFPSSYGSSISIVGALVLGEAAVSAGLVSPIMIIVIGVTFITSMVFTDLEVIYSLRHVRFLTLFLTCILGLYGLFISLFLFLIHLCSLHSLSIPYTYPVAPFDKTYFRKTLFRGTKKNDKYRSQKLTNKNFRKQGDNA